VLGVRTIDWLDLRDGSLPDVADLAEKIGEAVDRHGVDLVYSPSPLELHADHRAAAAAVVRALSARRPPVRVHWFGVNQAVVANVLYDVTAVMDLKLDAVSRFRSQLAYHDLVEKVAAVNRGATVNVDLPGVKYVEAYVALPSDALGGLASQVAGLERALDAAGAKRGFPAASAVVATWNKREELRENLLSLEAQTVPFAEIVVVDNHSTDGTAHRVRAEFPRTRLVVLPHDRYGACEAFNVGFATARSPYVAILDDDVTLPPTWLERLLERFEREPASTAMLSTKVVEPGMPAAYLASPALNEERYLSTFRGCGTLARREVLLEAGGYDERFFIYGNERDLAATLLTRGYRILQVPSVETFHKKPFGMKEGKRSLYFHTRNFLLYAFKHAPLPDLLAFPFRFLGRRLRRRRGGEAVEAVGTIGAFERVRGTPGGWWVVARAVGAALWLLPYCLRRRRPCRSPDFRMPLS
jgi:GT2 family glycosyltransferase